MVQAAGALVVPAIDPRSLRKLETHFVAPDIYRRDDVAVRQANLARVVSDEVVPRLLRLHADVLPDAPPVAVLIEALAPSAADVSALADIVLGPDLEAAAAYVMMLRDRGLSLDTLFVELLEPTARHLGRMWDNDECDFVDVTLGVVRLQKLLAIFNNTHEEPALETRRRVLMATMPGDQHRFGVTMVGRFLSAAGWQVQTEFASATEKIVGAAHRTWFAVAGLTAGSDRHLDGLRKMIVRLRERSLNPAIGIMVGGPMFTQEPGLASEIGADATAADAPAAVLVAQKLLDLAVQGLCADPARSA